MTNLFKQGLLNYLNEDQLQILQSKHIGIGGAGGIGSTLAVILTRTGFSHFDILDFDTIEPSNLNRQQYTVADIGKKKTAVLAEYLAEINPEINIQTHDARWDETAGGQFFGGCDFIIEAFDNREYKHRFIEFYSDRAPCLISANGMAGMSTSRPMTIRKVKNIYFVGDGESDIADGHPPLAPRVTLCAAMVAGLVTEIALK